MVDFIKYNESASWILRADTERRYDVLYMSVIDFSSTFFAQRLDPHFWGGKVLEEIVLVVHRPLH